MDDKRRATDENFQRITNRFTTGFGSLAATCAAGVLALSGNANPSACSVVVATACFAVGLPANVLMVTLFFKVTEPYLLDSIMDNRFLGFIGWLGSIMSVAGMAAVLCYFSYASAVLMILLTVVLLVWNLRYKPRRPAPTKA